MDNGPPPPPVPPPKTDKVILPKIVSKETRDKKPINKALEKKIHALKWRVGFGNREQYDFEVDDIVLEFAQKKQGELTGLGTGGNVWNGALVLSKYMEKQWRLQKEVVQPSSQPTTPSTLFARDWRGAKILELGSGVGIVGIVAAYFFKGATLTLTDQVQVLPIIEENVRRNVDKIGAQFLADSPQLDETKSKICVQEFNWGSDISLLDGPFDVIMACDCIAPIFPLDLLHKSLTELAGESTIVLIGYEHRHHTESFFQANTQLFNWLKMDDEDLDEKFSADDIDVYFVTKKPQ